MCAMKGYGRPELLADPDWLWEHRDDPKVRVIDCATSDAYDRAHIPSAVRVPGHPWLKTEPDPYSHMNEPLHVIGPDDFASAMGEIGVSNDTTVVAYDSVSHQFSTRLWWVLAYYGHRNAKVLDGGFHRWLTEGRPVSDAVPEVNAVSFVPSPDEAQIVRVDELLARYDELGVQVVNALGPNFDSGVRIRSATSASGTSLVRLTSPTPSSSQTRTLPSSSPLPTSPCLPPPPVFARIRRRSSTARPGSPRRSTSFP